LAIQSRLIATKRSYTQLPSDARFDADVENVMGITHDRGELTLEMKTVILPIVRVAR